jgi:hypothetical protein
MLKIQQTALDLWEADQQAFNESEKSAKKLGAALNKVKAAMPRGKYTPWLKQKGIDRNRANYCMRVASGKQEAKAKKTTSTVPEGFKKVAVLLTVPVYERLALIVKAQGEELGKYVSNVVTEHVEAQEGLANEILAAIESENQAREQAIEQERAAKAKAEAKKKEEALLAKSKKKAAPQEKAAAATA